MEGDFSKQEGGTARRRQEEAQRREGGVEGGDRRATGGMGHAFCASVFVYPLCMRRGAQTAREETGGARGDGRRHEWEPSGQS